MLNIQAVIKEAQETCLYEQVHKIYRDVKLEPGEIGENKAIFVKILGRCIATVETPKNACLLIPSLGK